MVNVIGSTSWSHPKSGGTSFTIPLPQTAVAGQMIIFTSSGGAISTPSMGASPFSRGTGAYGGGQQDVSGWYFSCAGGETTISVSLNGNGENVGGEVIQCGPGLTYNTGANNGSGSIRSLANDYQVTSPASTITANSFLVGVFSSDSSVAYSVANRLRQFGPLGQMIGNGANQDPSGTASFVWAVGIADITAASQYPPNLAAGHYQATSLYLGSGGTSYAAQMIFTDTSGVPSVPALNPVAAENSLPGTHNGNWYLNTAGTDSTIAGYTDKPSYAPGDTVSFKVDTTASVFPFRVEIYRLGWYGWELFGARNVLGNQAGYLTGTPVSQSPPTVDSTLGSSSCAWTTNATWVIPTNAVSGIYYVIFRRTDVTSHVSSCHFVVHDTSITNKIAVVIPDQTHQGYNVWGSTADHGDRSNGSYTGRNFYQAGTDGALANYAHRGYAVSFDRPYGTQSSQPVTYLFDSEYGFVNFAEAQGYNLTYLSDMDLEGNPTRLNNTSLVIMLGHHEYWTSDVYSAFQNAIQSGVNMFIYGSNIALWRCRFASADTTKRTLICYKEDGTRDVSAGWAGTGYDPDPSWTGAWRDSLPANGKTNNSIRRESQFGQLFVASGPQGQGSQIGYAYKGFPIWRNSPGIQALTVGQSYASTVNDIGFEVESPNGDVAQPPNLAMVFQYTATSMPFLANAAGTTYSGTGNVLIAWTLFQHPSAALVFHTGNWRALWAICRWQGGSPVSTVDVNIQNAVLAMLYDLGAVPTAATALQPGTDTAVTDPSVGAPAKPRSLVALAYGLQVPTPPHALANLQAVARSANY